MSASTATSIMQTFGNTTSVKLRQDTRVFDPVTGTQSGGTTIDVDVLAVIGRVPNRMIDGSRVVYGDKMLTIDAAVVPTEKDEILIKGVPYKIVLIDAPMVKDEELYYRVVCRG